jgi:phospholipid-binding lipoprotein MlaA
MNIFINKIYKLCIIAFVLPNIALGAEEIYTSYDEDDEINSTYLAEDVMINDPFESLNRKIFAFNQKFYQVVMNPVTATYRVFIPEWGRSRVSSFINNLNEPVHVFNNLFQGDVEGGFASFWRFTINSTFGIGGLFDVAHAAGIKEQREDFGRTLASYGAKPGAYLVLPFLGPSSFRDLSGRLVDITIDPFNYILTDDQLVARNSMDIVESYSENKELIDNTTKNSLDPYAAFRSLYTQNRMKDLDLIKKSNKFIKGNN